MKWNAKTLALLTLGGLFAPAVLLSSGHASDHADTPDIYSNPGTDITDVYMFPSPSNSNNVVLSMNVHPLIGPGQGGNVSFDPNVLYQMKVDNNGDNVEDLVLQFRFKGTGPNQLVNVSGLVKPKLTGSINRGYPSSSAGNKVNTVFTTPSGIKTFTGPREDAFFFDLEQFFNILPDRATPITGVMIKNPNNPQQTTWRPQGQAVDFLSNGGYNVLSIVVEVPKALLKGPGENGDKIALWTTTSVPNGYTWTQMDRLARPAVNEVFATVAYGRHEINDKASPVDDANELAGDIESFMTFPAGRSQQIRNVVKAVLVPDVLRANLSETTAAYLGYETNGATGGKFGGRALTDDIIDISLGVIFGNTIPALGLAAEDNKEIPTLTSDHVGPEGKHFLATFPYLGDPR